jgi:hypothetical protein
VSKHASPIHTTPYVPRLCVQMADAIGYAYTNGGRADLHFTMIRNDEVARVCMSETDTGKTAVGTEAEKQ